LFKARGLWLRYRWRRRTGVRRIAIPTNGNAARRSPPMPRAARIGLLLLPGRHPEINLSEIALQGAAVWRVNG